MFTRTESKAFRFAAFVVSVFALVFSDARLFAQGTIPMPDHVVILIEENQPNFLVIGNTTAAPFVNQLVNDTNAAVFTKMYAIEHPSQPDYLDLFSGSNQGVLDDNLPSNYPYTTANMGRELLDIGRSFATYSQDLPSVGFDGVSSGSYVRKHNPVTNWVGTGTNQLPATMNLPYDSFPVSDFSKLPTICYVVPNEDSDMHNGFGNAAIAPADYWFKEHLQSFLTWAVTHNTLFIYTFDEDDGLANNNIPTIFYGPMVKGGSYSQHHDLFDILRTLEDMYHTTGHAGKASTATPITECWRSVATAVENTEIPEASVRAYPNPASSVITFDGSKLEGLNVQISILDIAGRKLADFQLPDSKKLEVNTSAYPAGLYLYQLVQSGHSLQTGKFVISKQAQ